MLLTAEVRVVELDRLVTVVQLATPATRHNNRFVDHGATPG